MEEVTRRTPRPARLNLEVIGDGLEREGAQLGGRQWGFAAVCSPVSPVCLFDLQWSLNTGEAS